MKVWIDTDVGGDIDDALTLLLALASPEVELVGVSTVFENTLARAEIAKTLLSMGGRPEVPVYAGEGLPLRARSVFGAEIDVSAAPKTYERSLFAGAHVEEGAAVEAMERAFLACPGEITLVTLGALTNVARLIERCPEAASAIGRIFIMGGARERNLNEFNFTCDPEAAHAVLASESEKRIVTLDVTFQCGLSPAQAELLHGCESAAVRTVLRMNRLWGGAMILHDPLTLACALDESFVRFVHGDLFVELEGEYSRGKCVDLCDFNWRRPPRPDLAVSAAVDAARFLDFYVERICCFDAALRGAPFGYEAPQKIQTIGGKE